jgi:HK97 gp10 family phage protein
MSFNMHVQGFDNLKRNVSRLKKNVQKQVKDEVMGALVDIQLDAKRSPNIVDFGVVRSSIQMFPDSNRLGGNVTVGTHYAPYVEFGTGNLVKVDAEFTEYALQFLGKGIRQVNLPARPFLMPAFVKNRALLIESLKNMKVI